MKRIRFSAEGSGDGTKRRQVKRACSKCRKSKRACRHVLDEEVRTTASINRMEYSSPAVLPSEPPVLALEENVHLRLLTNEDNRSCESRSPDGPVLQALSQSQHNSISFPLPFAGASSAFSLLLHSTASSPSAHSPTATMNRDLNSVTEAIMEHHLLPPARRLRPSLQDIKAGPSERRPGIGPTYLPMVVRAVLPYLEIECLDVLPPPEDLDALMRIYRREIHPLLPIVDFSTSALATPAKRDKPASIVIRQAICLAACKSGAAQPYLRLRVPREEGDGEGDAEEHHEHSRPFALQTTWDFANRLFSCLKISLDIGLVEDRLELVQLLALMTFHSYGLDGDEEVSRLCGQAVHYAYSAGLHQSLASSSAPSSSLSSMLPCEVVSATKVSEVRRLELMCSIYALDKIIAMITGRPAVAHRREIHIPSPDSRIWEPVSPGVQILFHLSEMLDLVLGLYRSSPPNGQGDQGDDGGWSEWKERWPDFEQIGRDFEIDKLEFPLQATLEVLYLVIAMLSYRPSLVLADQPDSGHGTPAAPTPIVPPLSLALRNARARQRYAVQQMSSLPILELSMLPYIPYAVSLSLSMGLRDLREESLESTKRRAKTEIETSLKTLDGLGQRYWLADSMSKTGRRLYADVCGVRTPPMPI